MSAKPSRKTANVKFRGQAWKVILRSPGRMRDGLSGECRDWSREIIVKNDGNVREMVDTLIHECLHASSPVLYEAENFVEQTATAISDLLVHFFDIKLKGAASGKSSGDR